MANDKHALWVEKYRPPTLDSYIFHDDKHRASFRRMVEEKSIPHLLFSGVQGSGKTTIAQILIRELEIDPADVLTINASDEARIDDIRERIKTFVSTFGMGEMKVVHLEEADYLHHTGQAILRRMMEEFSDTARFILTCNHENKIIPAIKSRTQHYRFKASDLVGITDFVARILIAEHIAFDLELLDKYVTTGYPDIRKIINLLQQNCIDKTLQPMTEESELGDYKFALLDALETDAWLDARKVVCENVGAEEWEDLYTFLYHNLHKTPKFSVPEKWEAGIVIIADHLYKHGIVAAPEINAAAMFIRLGQI